MILLKRRPPIITTVVSTQAWIGLVGLVRSLYHQILDGFPILVTVVIIKWSKVDAIVEVRQKNQQVQKEKEQAKLDKFKKGQCDLQDELDQVTTQKEKLA